MAKKKIEATKSVAKLDPTKNYRWDKETKFTFSGEEFAFLYNNLNQFLTGNLSPQSFFRLADVSAVLQLQLAKAVELGDAVEVMEEVN